ncbi:hypothetical protein [Streptomyces sp. NBC_00233]|uniref:phage tail protein n=1 Tax=Streptomyces sp. NBC_00233 TaxID=2975686 RepID=UPI002255B0C5|nr:hypothetical protein [Streptomyces sp. NBC_00233]MCX5229666.1 hypothetical protein [Streptomyces sp. NBC_00233]
MALTVGELVGVLRADDSGWRSGLAAARLRLRGLTIDANGQLRDLRGRFVTEGEAAGRGFADGIRHYSGIAVTALKKIGPAAASVSLGLPAVAALLAALGGLAAGAVAAGLAVGAFAAAVKPQMALMQESAAAADKLAKAQEAEARKGALAAKLKAQGSDLAKKAEKAYQTARLATKDAEAAYQRQTAGMPKATRDAALAQAKLKVATEEWSTSLADSTMPVFTRGLDLLRSLLPTLTPFVKAAAKALGDMLDRVAVGVKGAEFKEWAADMAAASGTALTNFIKVIGNLGRGFMGLMQAFLPTSLTVTGGLVTMTQAFADWGTSLKGSEGFAEFLEMAGQGGGTFLNLAKAVGALLVAAAPLMGALTQIANAIATIINNTPTDTLTAIGTALLIVKVGMIGYAVGAKAVALANTIMASSAWVAIAGWFRMLGVGLMVYARLAAAAVLSATRTAAAWLGSALASLGTFVAQLVRTAVTATAQFALIAVRAVAAAATTAAAWTGSALASMATFAVQVVRTATIAVAQFVLMAGRAVIWAATMAAQWLIAMGPVGWVIAVVIGLVALIIANWDKIKKYTGIVWDWLWTKIKAIGSFILNYVLGWKIVSYFLAHWDRIKSGIATKGTQLLGWFKAFPGRIASALGSLGSLLYSKGINIVQGLWRGIQSMGGWIKSQIMGWARNVIPGPIAKVLGIASPSKVTAKQGQWIARGLVVGMTAGMSQIRSTASKMANIIIDATTVKLTPKKKGNSKKQNRAIDERNKQLLASAGKQRSKALKILNSGTSQLLKLASREELVASRLKAANKSLQDQIKARNTLAADVKQGVLDAANITQTSDQGGTTATSIWSNLNVQLQKAKTFAAQLATLRKKGVRADLIAQIAQAGVEQGSAAAAALATASSGQIAQINSTQKLLVAAATQAGNTAGEAMYGAGIRAAQGLVKGLQAEQSAIEKQMLKIAVGMQKAIKKALGIKSPSRVMAAVGRYIPAGLVRGIEAGRSAVDASMSSLVTPPRPAMAATGGLHAPGPSGSGVRAQAPTVLEIQSGGSRLDDLLVEVLRSSIKAKGGNVQVVLGQRR